MAVSKEFLEAVSRDDALRAEAEVAVLGALAGFLKERGLEEEVGRVVEAATEEFAETHGFEPHKDEELDLDELDAVAGGYCRCPIVGGGTGTGKKCVCIVGGGGKNDSGEVCPCVLAGKGLDDEPRK